MKTEDFLDIAMSLGEGVPEESKIEMLLALARKDNLLDWSCCYVGKILKDLGYEYSKIDVPLSYKYVGQRVSGEDSRQGDIVVYTDQEGTRVGFLFRRTREVVPPHPDAEPKEGDSKVKDTIVIKYMVVTSNDSNAIIKYIVNSEDVIHIARMNKIKE